MKSAGRRIRNILQSKKGFTLIEMVITVILIGIFFVMGSSMLLSSMRLYRQAKSAEYSEQVSDTLMTKIAGEIAGAQNSTITVEGDESSESNYEVVIASDHKTIELYDRTGSHIAIYTDENGEVVIKYYPVETTAAEGGNGQVRYKEVYWQFDPGNTDTGSKMYMGYKIDKLTFEPVAGADGNNTNLVKVTLVITDMQYGFTATTEKTVHCYNFPKIVVDGEGGGGGEPGTPGEPETPEEPDPPDKEPEKYPGTDIVLDSYYWPQPSDYPKGWESVEVKAGGIFQYTDGNYYIVVKDTAIIKGQAESGPGGDVYGWFVTVKVTGRIVTFDQNEQKSDLARGDLCKVGDDYYTFIDGGSVAYGPTTNQSKKQWYKIPSGKSE